LLIADTQKANTHSQDEPYLLHTPSCDPTEFTCIITERLTDTRVPARALSLGEGADHKRKTDLL